MTNNQTKEQEILKAVKDILDLGGYVDKSSFEEVPTEWQITEYILKELKSALQEQKEKILGEVNYILWSRLEKPLLEIVTDDLKNL